MTNAITRTSAGPRDGVLEKYGRIARATGIQIAGGGVLLACSCPVGSGYGPLRRADHPQWCSPRGLPERQPSNRRGVSDHLPPRFQVLGGAASRGAPYRGRPPQNDGVASLAPASPSPYQRCILRGSERKRWCGSTFRRGSLTAVPPESLHPQNRNS